jgi:hypothetical protein
MRQRAQRQLNKSKRVHFPARGWFAIFPLIAFLFKGYAGVTSLYIESDVGDPMENGQTFFLTTAEAEFAAHNTSEFGGIRGNGVFVWVHVPYGHQVSSDFIPPLNQVLNRGLYTNVAYYPRPDQSGLIIEDNFGISYDVTGWFEIKQIVFGSGGEVLQFWATFEQHVNGAIPGLRGEIRFNSDLAEPPVRIQAPGGLAVLPGQTISFAVTATDAGNRTVSMTASNLPAGASFVDNGNNSGVFSWMPGSDQSGTYTVTFLADNQNGGTDQFFSRLIVNVPNDDFSNALVIAAANFTNTVNISTATVATDDPGACGIPTTHTIWYSFVAPTNMPVEAMISGTTTQISMGAYLGPRGGLSLITCGHGLQANLKFDATGGQTYYLMVGSAYDDPGGLLTFTLLDLTPPPNPADRHAVHRYFPLHDGDSRNYSGNGVNLTLSVAPWNGDGVPMLFVRNSIDQSTTDYTYTETGLVMHSLTSGGYKLYIDAFDELSESLILNGGTQITRTAGSFLGHPVNITFKAAVKNAGTIAVPAGTYENCRDVTETMLISIPHGRSSKSRQHFILAPEVGVIKIFSSTHPTESIGLVSGTIDGSSVSSLAPSSAIASPRILSQPKKQTPLDGSHAEFDVIADGAGPLSFQWFKNGIVLTNGSLVSGADTSHLVLSAVDENDLGNYSVTITNQAGLINSASAPLTLKPDNIRPILTITSPRPRGQVLSSPVTIVGRASDNAAVAQILYQLNGGEWFAISGTTNWQTSVSLSPGENPFRVYAIDFAGNYSRTNSLTVLY